ncbi:MAG: hydroxymethylglutaryl-CoA lyase [Deltaproteobacteria bacterium]|nr:hydroxymethylglutaryl-CoA lyase [Deltaproteobacteria bacterium]
MMRIPKQVEIVDVAPRDGLQNLATAVPTEQKIKLVNELVHAGVPRIEATSFSHPKWVPQLRDAGEVLAEIDRSRATRFMVLIPNMRGYERARRYAGLIDEVAVVISATETMNRRNVNASIAESMRQFGQIAEQAKKDGLRIRGSIAVAFVCPFEGTTPAEQPLRLAEEFVQMGMDEILFADTIGRANPPQVADLLNRARERWPDEPLAVHFHDTYHMALANTLSALQAGVAIFDASVGGLGGCPFMPKAAGNVATERLLFMLHEMGIETGIDYDALLKAAAFAKSLKQPDTKEDTA